MSDIKQKQIDQLNSFVKKMQSRGKDSFRAIKGENGHIYVSDGVILVKSKYISGIETTSNSDFVSKIERIIAFSQPGISRYSEIDVNELKSVVKIRPRSLEKIGESFRPFYVRDVHTKENIAVFNPILLLDAILVTESETLVMHSSTQPAYLTNQDGIECLVCPVRMPNFTHWSAIERKVL